MKLNFSLDAAIIIAIITAILYLVGQAYLNGYVSVFGADIFVLNYSIQDKLSVGYLKSLWHTIGLVLGIIIFFIIIPFIFKESRLNAWIYRKINGLLKRKKKILKHCPTIHNTSKELQIEEDFDRNFFWTYLIFVVLLVLPFYIIYVDKYAKADATLNLEDYSKKLSKIIILNQPKHEAYKITCNQNLCAVLVVNGKEKSLQYIDPKNISFPLKSSIK